MRWTAIVSVLAILVVLGGCQGRGKVPETRPGDFTVILTSEAYPAPAPDIRVTLYSDGTGTYQLVFKQPHPGQAQGPFTATPEQVDAVFAAVKEADFFKLDEDYISDPPTPGRGVDKLLVSAGGITHEVLSEYSVVADLDLVRSAVMKVIPPAAYAGGSLSGKVEGFIVDKTTKLIYAADSPEVEDIPEENRIAFPSVYEALDAGYHPSPSLREQQ